jgi:predicted ATPase
LRTDKGNDKIHIIGLFDQSVSGQTIYDSILCPLGFSKDEVTKKTNEQVYCTFEDACKKIHEQKGLVLLHAGNKANGIEQLDSDLKSLLKTDMASMVDIFEVNSKKNAEDYRSIVFPKIKRFIPCITTSDSVNRSKLTFGEHSTEVIGKAFSWIKADLSFTGLRQILSEPKGRVYLGSEPSKLSDLKVNQARYIDSIKINPTTEISPAWFQNKLFFSYELTAVIGKKGSGKSALVDILALCGKSHVPVNDYSFLKPNKFRKIIAIAKEYIGEMTWLNKDSVVMNLADEVDNATQLERVKYLPQSFIEQVCNEDGVSDLFQEEINKVIFSYVPPEKRLGTNSLTELIQVKTEVVDSSIKRIRNEINTENQTVVALEEKQTKEYKKKIENMLIEKKKEHDTIKDPDSVKEPNEKLTKSDHEKLKGIVDSIDTVEKEIVKAINEQTEVNNGIAFIGRLQGKIKELQEEKERILTSLTEEAKAIGIDLSTIIKLNITNKKISDKLTLFTEKQVILNIKLDKNCTNSKTCLYAQKVELEASKTKITSLFDEHHKKYQEYLADKKRAQDARTAIKGEKGDISLETITSLEVELDYLSSKLGTDLISEYSARQKLVSTLYETIAQQIDLYKDIYQPLIDCIENGKLKQESSGNVLTFDAGVAFNKNAFVDSFLDYINQGRDGSFQSKDKGNKILKEILVKYSIQSKEEVCKMIEDILHNLNYDTTQIPEKANDIQNQINNRYTSTELYNFLFQLSYLNVRFKILFNGKDLNENEFSPGEKGALLLIFYLLIDNERIPLIMDQPEENLDNESVYSLLVPYIKLAKEKRQIIIVTHNPNLAVVCDAEQVICASMNKKKNEIRYESGSIENLHMNNKIVDVLEGTMPAFTKRDEKYLR